MHPKRLKALLIKAEGVIARRQVRDAILAGRVGHHDLLALELRGGRDDDHVGDRDFRG